VRTARRAAVIPIRNDGAGIARRMRCARPVRESLIHVKGCAGHGG